MSTAVTPEITLVVPGKYGCPCCRNRFETVGDKRRHIKAQHPVEVAKAKAGGH